jgi:hypothetical protein
MQIRIHIMVKSRIRIRIKFKSWVRIRIEVDTDLPDCLYNPLLSGRPNPTAILQQSQIPYIFRICSSNTFFPTFCSEKNEPKVTERIVNRWEGGGSHV